MAENEHLPALQDDRSIRWNHYNYPPLLKIIHFVPSELPKNKKFIVLSLFIIHLAILLNCFLNFIGSCAQGGLRVLYSLLFLLCINPFVLLVFYKGLIGICKDSNNLKVYFILQPIAILLEMVVSIIGAFGFNGFSRAHALFSEGSGFAGVLSVIISIVFMGAGLFSTFILVRILREKQQLTVDIP